MRRITSRANPLVHAFRALASGADTRGADLLIDGEHLLREARGAGVPITTLALSTRALQQPELSSLAAAVEAEGAEVVVVPEALFAVMSPVRSPSGIVAIGTRDAASLTSVFAGSAPLAVIAVDVQDPGNVGALLRAAEAGGATGAVVCGASADPLGWKALRGSMGSAFRLRLARTTDPQQAVEAARTAGARLVATTPRGGRNVYEVDLKGPVAVLVGGEGPGLPGALLREADHLVSIPMKPPVESLNVAVATALVVYEAARQRGSAAAWRSP